MIAALLTFGFIGVCAIAVLLVLFGLASVMLDGDGNDDLGD